MDRPPTSFKVVCDLNCMLLERPKSVLAIILLFSSHTHIKEKKKTIDLRITEQGCHFFFFPLLKTRKSKTDFDRSLVLCWREAAVTVSCSDLTLLRLLWLNFRPNPVCYQCSGTMSGCLLSGSGVSKNRVVFFFFLRLEQEEGSGVGTAAISAWLPLSLLISVFVHCVPRSNQ